MAQDMATEDEYLVQGLSQSNAYQKYQEATLNSLVQKLGNTHSSDCL